MSKSPNRKAEERFKQLCLSGIDGNLLLPELLKALQEVVFFHVGTFTIHNEHSRYSQPSYVHSEIPEFEQALLPYVEYMGQWVPENFKSPFDEALIIGKAQGLETSLKVSRKEFERHDFYQLIYREILRFGSQRASVAPMQGKFLGAFNAIRPTGDPDFSFQDEQAIVRLMPFFGHAMTAKPHYDGPWAESEDKGLILLKSCGSLQHICPTARKLLYGASFTPDIRDQAHSLRRLLNDLSRRMLASFTGKKHSVPVWECRNSCGRFTFRAFWLDGGQADGDGLIGVTVERQVPTFVKLLEKMDSLPLSPREKEISLLLVQGLSYAAIAEKFCRSERTIITHAQNIFAKLGVANRVELTSRLLMG